MSFSRASTVTLQGEEVLLSQEDSFAPEEVPDYLLEDPEDNDSLKRLIVAVDFGTTYSAVSYAALEAGEGSRFLRLDEIHSIQNFPDDWNVGGAGAMKCEVPTEVIYPLDRHFRSKEDLAVNGGSVEDAEASGPAEPPSPVQQGPPQHGSPGISIFRSQGDDNDDEEDRMSIDETDSFRWGYGVHEACCLQATHADPTNKPLSRFKLLLDNSPMTDKVREELAQTLKNLKKRKIIKNDLDPIVDFLTCLLRHAKSELAAAGFDGSYRTEVVLCVPAIWSQSASRSMQTAMARAVAQARFGGVDVQNDSIGRLFIVSEPEAAAAYVLAEERDISVKFIAFSTDT